MNTVSGIAITTRAEVMDKALELLRLVIESNGKVNIHITLPGDKQSIDLSAENMNLESNGSLSIAKRANEIIRLYNEKGLTQREIAKKYGTTQANISKILLKAKCKNDSVKTDRNNEVEE